MSDEASFLAAIAATPEDTAPRLAFADWLDDRDDFRGEFVRTGVAFDRTPPHDVTRFQIAERLRELLESPPFRAWLPAHPAFKWGWRRGFLRLRADAKRLRPDDPAELAGWLSSNWIERVEFVYSHGPGPDSGDSFGLVSNARELHFGTDDYGPDVLTRLREWPHLRGLSLPYLMVPWADLAALPHLRALALHNPDWTMMPELHEARLPRLEVLSLNKEWNDDLPHWGTCFPRLRSLTLTHYNAYPDEHCDRFAECPDLHHLALHLRYQPLTRVGLKALVKAKELRSLALGPMPRGSIEGLAKLSNLERLHADGRARRLRGLEALTGLRWLSLGTAALTGAIAAQTVALPHLARLDLSCEAFEAGAIATLAKAPALRILTVDIADEPPALSELVRLEGLQYLRVGPPGLPPADLLSLQAALPTCRIVNDSPDTGDDNCDWS